jgi:hypothetical protein
VHDLQVKTRAYDGWSGFSGGRVFRSSISDVGIVCEACDDACVVWSLVKSRLLCRPSWKRCADLVKERVAAFRRYDGGCIRGAERIFVRI